MPYTPDRGDIVYIDFSPQSGSEQANRRPGLVLSPSAYNGVVGLALVVPITSKVKGFRFEVPLPSDLATHGVVLSDHVRSVDWRSRNAVFEEIAPESLVDEVVARIAALLKLT